ncbi:MAG: hypothetical protein M1465_00520 [Candidatus Marsarchaeota archaeon]|nr:hypothetical protein [Candidatus Marsarchaeota archaeon]
MQNKMSINDLLGEYQKLLDEMLTAAQYVGKQKGIRIHGSVERQVDELADSIALLKTLKNKGWDIINYNHGNCKTAYDSMSVPIRTEYISAGVVTDLILLADITTKRGIQLSVSTTDALKFIVPLRTGIELALEKRRLDTEYIDAQPTTEKEELLRNKISDYASDGLLHKLVDVIGKYYKIEDYVNWQATIRKDNPEGKGVAKFDLSPVSSVLAQMESVFDSLLELKKQGWSVFESSDKAFRRNENGSFSMESSFERKINAYINFDRNDDGSIILGSDDIHKGTYVDITEIEKLTTKSSMWLTSYVQPKNPKKEARLAYAILLPKWLCQYLGTDFLYVAPRFLKAEDTEKLQQVKLGDGTYIYANDKFIDDIFGEDLTRKTGERVDESTPVAISQKTSGLQGTEEAKKFSNIFRRGEKGRNKG